MIERVAIADIKIGERRRRNLDDLDVERFWTKVDKVGPTPSHCPELGNCWEWTAGCSSGRYGGFYMPSKAHKGGLKIATHRLSWELANGPIPSGMEICHHCDNPKCVNPQHLFLGTTKTNAEDRNRKGRGNFLPGEDHPRARFTAADVLYMRERYAAGGITLREIGLEFGASKDCVGNIVKGRSWKSVPLVETGG